MHAHNAVADCITLTGANTAVLTADSLEALGLKWAIPSAGGAEIWEMIVYG